MKNLNSFMMIFIINCRKLKWKFFHESWRIKWQQFQNLKRTYKSWFITKEEWLISEEFREGLQVLFAHFNDLIWFMNANTLCLDLLGCLNIIKNKFTLKNYIEILKNSPDVHSWSWRGNSRWHLEFYYPTIAGSWSCIHWPFRRDSLHAMP